ncbi:esterase [Scytonema hofmannii PCC 7110]|uniref:Esterase n=1 Tax=Scytonema hofmannii PCC 7110 TaxID=128403 RepID=A0A139WV83_9CYAN|nr:alpha/beta hydrolase [Scytonema hofmannii]KYC36345.1 esterase [Scytonema hofmannii PCC 7110]
MKRRQFVNLALSTVAIIVSNSIIAQSISAVDSQSVEKRRRQRKITTTTRDTQPPHILTLDDILALPDVPADRRIFYGPDPDQFGDLYLPKQPGPHPVVLLLHGGCWLEQFSLSTTGHLAAALRRTGLAVWNLEYRRLGNGGGWPATFQDVAMGADFLRTIAPEFDLDLDRLVTMGHSAGGHLALWLAGRHRLPDTSPLYVGQQGVRVRGVVSLAGIPDLITGVQLNICNGACYALVDGFPEEVPDRYQQASPLALLPLGVPQWHLVGTEDEIVPASYIQQYVEVATQYDEVHLEVLPNAGHFEPIVPTTAVWPAVRHAVLALVERTPSYIR